MGKARRILRRDFLLNRVFGAQKYRHALRENRRICCFFENGGEKAKFDEYLSLYLKDNCSDGKVKVRMKSTYHIWLVFCLYNMYPKILRRKTPFGILEE